MTKVKKFKYSRVHLEHRLREMAKNGLVFSVEREEEYDEESNNYWTNYQWDSSAYANVSLGSCAECTDDVFVSVKDPRQETVLLHIIGVELIPR